jgi:hypothetical protein
MMMRMMTPLSECVTNSPLYITNTACEFVTNQGWTVTFDVQGTNGPADIFATTNLMNSLTNTLWAWLERGPSCATYQYTNQPGARAFYILGTTNDTDSDLLTDAYEKLVSKTLVNDADTDNDGMPDGWEVNNGLNPPDPADATDDPDGDWQTNLQEYNGGANSTHPRDVMVVAYAGQTRELKISSLPTEADHYNRFVIDSISFSDQPIPEPGACGLICLGALLFGFRSRLVRRS